MKLSLLRKHIIRIMPYPFFAALVILTCINFTEVKKELTESIYDCLDVIIPTLFPFMLLSSFAVKYGLPYKICRFFHKPLKILFGLSGNCLTAIITGLTGGYIVSPKNAAELYSDGIIDIRQAKRLSLFFTAPGISFCIFFAGKSVYGSFAAGISLFISTVLSSLISAFVFNIFSRHSPEFSSKESISSLRSSMLSSVSDTASALISICSFILLFCFVTTIVSSSVSSPAIKFLINYLSEVTAAVKYTEESLSLRYAAFTLSFGGICILLQQFPYISKLNIKLSHFLLSKLVQAILCCFIHNIIINIFPVVSAVSSVTGKLKASYHSPYGSLSLIVLLIIFLYTVSDISRRKNFFHPTNNY